MQKLILIYGIIAGSIVSGFLFLSTQLWEDGTIDFDNGELIGYTTMAIALSMVFFGIKSYRDNYQNGMITFGKGFQVGIMITLVASLMYAFSWEAYYQSQPADQATFMEQYVDYSINKMKEEGASQTEIDEATEEMAGMSDMYKNPVMRFGITLMEILPVGIMITLLSASLLRRKHFLPAQ